MAPNLKYAVVQRANSIPDLIESLVADIAVKEREGRVDAVEPAARCMRSLLERTFRGWYVSHWHVVSPQPNSMHTLLPTFSLLCHN